MVLLCPRSRTIKFQTNKYLLSGNPWLEILCLEKVIRVLGTISFVTLFFAIHNLLDILKDYQNWIRLIGVLINCPIISIFTILFIFFSLFHSTPPPPLFNSNLILYFNLKTNDRISPNSCSPKSDIRKTHRLSIKQLLDLRFPWKLITLWWRWIIPWNT